MTENAIPLILEGQLTERALSDVLLELGRHRATGILTIQGETDILAISFFQGGIVSTDSLNRTLEEGLGEVVEQEGWVSAENYASLASEYRSGGGRVVDLLVERDYLTERQLGLALRMHIYRLGLDAFRWQDGEYKFYAGDEVSYEQCIRPISIEEFVVQAARDLGSMGPLDGGVATRATPYRRTPDLPPIKDHNTLTVAEQWLMHELEQPSTVGELIDRGEHNEFEVLFYVWRLGRRGLLQRGEEVPTDSASPQLEGPVLSAMEEPSVSVPPITAGSSTSAPSVGPTRVSDPAPEAASGAESPIVPFPVTDRSADVIELPQLQDIQDLQDSGPEVISLGPIAQSAGSLAAPPIEMPEADASEGAPPGAGDWEAEPERAGSRRRPALALDHVVPWAARAIAGFGAALLLGGLIAGGDRTVLPFPWHSGPRADLVRQRQAATLARLDEGLQTFFLLNGAFPEDLGPLGAEGWVRGRDLVDGDGRPFAYSPTTSTFVVQSALAEIGGSSDWLHQGGITGNFLLDPDLAAFTDAAEVPLVLLD